VADDAGRDAGRDRGHRRSKQCLRPSPFHLGPIIALLSWNCFALFALPGIGWPVTAMRARKQSLVSALIGHFTMGVALGLGFVLLISLIDRFGVRDLVAHSDAPFGTMSVIVGSFALMFGIGATLTGLLMTMEDDG
jgi:hypothetical protein